MPERLPVQCVQHGVAGAVCRRAGALSGRALAEIGRHASKGPLIDFAIFGARKRHAVVLKLINSIRGVTAEIFDGVLVAEPVGAFDGVVHMPTPIVGAHVAERRRHAALRRDRVRARWKNFGNAGRLEPGFSGTKRGAQASASCAHDHYVIGVVR